MGILTRLERRSPENPAVSLSDPAIFDMLGHRPTASGVVVTEETSIRYGTVFACVRILSETVASLPLLLYRRLEDGGKERATEDPLYRLLHNRPNPEINAYTFWSVMTAHMALWGNCYAEIVRNGAGRVTELWPLPPWKVDVDRSERTGSRIYRVNVSGRRIRAGADGTRVLFEDEVFHVPGLLFDGLKGKSPLAAYRQAVGLGLAMEEFGARFFGGGSQLSGVLTHPKALSDKARENLRKEWDSLRGIDHAHRVAVLEEGLSWEQMGVEPEAAQFLESRKFQVEEIARIFRIPLVLLQHTEKATSWGSGVEQFMLAFVVHTMRPWLVNFEQEIWHDLIPTTQQGRLFAEFLVDGMLRGDAQARGEFYSKLFQVGGITINEIRARENLNPVEGGDSHFVPTNMQTLDRALEPPAPPAIAPPDDEDDEDEEPIEREAARLMVETRMDMLGEQLRVVAEERESLQGELEATRAEVETLQAARTAADEAVEAHVAERAALQERIDSLASEMEALTTRATEAEAELAEATDRVADLERERREAAEALEALRADHEAQVAERDRRVSEVEAQSDAEREAAVAEIEARDAAVEMLEARVTELEADQERLAAEQEAAEAEAREWLESAQAEVQARSEELERLTAERADLEQRIQALEAAALEAEQDAAAQRETLEAQVREAQARAQALEAEVAVRVETEREREVREARSVNSRYEIQRGHFPAFRKRAEELTIAETDAVREALELIRRGDVRGFELWMEDFYPEHRTAIRGGFEPLVLALARSTYPEAAAEVGGDTEVPESVEVFAAEYVENMAMRETLSSHNQLRAIIDDTPAGDLESTLHARTAEWRERRPTKIGMRETRQLGNAVSRLAYGENGVTQLRWVAFGSDTCPYCSEMDGRIVGIEGAFLREGDELVAGDAPPMRISGNRFGPPIHTGCVCQIVAEVGSRREGPLPDAYAIAIRAVREHWVPDDQDPPGPDRSAATIAAHRGVWSEVMGRLVRKEAAAAKRAAKKPDEFRAWADSWYETHRGHVAESVEPVMRLHLALMGSRADPAHEATKLAADHCHESWSKLIDLRDRVEDEKLGEAVGVVVTRWERDRADQVADKIMREELRRVIAE